MTTHTRRKAVPRLRDHVPLTSDQLRAGMFVIALDRPWEGTPFHLQGFLIDSPEQLAALRTLCASVVIDPRRSAQDALRELTNLYELPDEEEEVAPEEEGAVRVRFVHAQARPAPKEKPSLKEVREAMNAVLKRVRGGTSLADAMDAAARRRKERQSGARTPAPAAWSPREIYYAANEDLSGRSRDGRDVQIKSRRVRPALRAPTSKAVGPEDPQSSEKLLRFDRIIDGLYPLFGGVIERAGAWARMLVSLRKLWQRAAPAVFVPNVRRRPEEARAAVIPRSIELVIYRDRDGIEKEIFRAREAVDAVESALGSLRADFLAESLTRLDNLPIAVDAMVESVKRNPDALLWTSRMRRQNAASHAHGIRVAAYMLAFGRHLGFPPEQMTQLATIGLLMDVGKLRIDEALLNKQSALTESEFSQVKQHVEIGLAMLTETMTLDAAVRDGIAQHHEWMNGSGYPEGLAGDEISVFGRMAAIVDAFSALTTHRPYSKPLSSYEALRLIYSLSGKQFHEPLVEQFVQAIGIFPIGSLVLLSTEEVGVVLSHDRVQRMEPIVLVLTDYEKKPLPRPLEINLQKKPDGPNGQPIRILRSLPAGAYGVDFRNFYIS